MKSIHCSILVVGGGNAGFSAALSAAQSLSHEGKVILIDACPPSWAGGNSYFTAGAFRVSHRGLSDLLPIVTNVSSSDAKMIDLDPYTNEDFLADMDRITHSRYDRGLGRVLVEESNETVKWLAGLGLGFELSFNRQAYKVSNRYKFFGGLALKTQDGGKGLIQFHQSAAKKLGVEVLYSSAARKINLDPKTGAFESLLAEKDGQPLLIKAKAVILAAGGFESNPLLRAQHLGPGWDLAHVRGTPFNTGSVLNLAMRDVIARKQGDWSGCHSVAWDANSPTDSGDREITNEFTKSGYPLGITVNVEGERFFDEGSDLRNYTYAKFGRAILSQKGGVAFQVWDQKGIPWLRNEEYRDEIVEKIWGSSIQELAQNSASRGLENPDNFVNTIMTYNAAVYAHKNESPSLEWDPAILDGLSTQSIKTHLKIPKSNWALPIDEGPFMAVKVGCGVTFTFGGLAIDPGTAGVISDATGQVVPGIFCAGEMVGGLFYENYPGGSGLTSGSVFGRKAGLHGANFVNESMTGEDS